MKNEKITIKEMKEKANIQHLSNEAIKFYIKDLQDEGKGKRAIINKLIKEDEKITEYKNAKHIKDMTITIEWKKSRTWGANPHAQIKGHYIDNSYFYDNNDFTCSGCGYDKESTVLSQIFNKSILCAMFSSAFHVLKVYEPLAFPVMLSSINISSYKV